MSADAARPAYTRHSTYWEEETRTYVYAVEKTLYHFPLAVLTRMSPPLTAIFGIPPSQPGVTETGQQLPREGTEENPIVIPSISVGQMDDFLAFFFKSTLLPPEKVWPERTEQIGFNLLTVGGLWDIEEAQEYGKGLLESLPLSLSRKLRYARMFRISEWVPDLVKKMIPLAGTFSSADALEIGPTHLQIFYSAKTMIDEERLKIVFTPPKLTPVDHLGYGDCWDHKSCERVWRESWWPLVGRKVLHPARPMALDAIAGHLSKLSLPGMTQKCHEDAVIKWTMNTWEYDGILEGAIEGVLAFHR
ncbi:hypothetical protein C8R46DRAFT_1232484 [Mycena filopes]|nr:hypothetical protein C8R46DRAFT_1232484 [Mycena filopes]